jgi:hypothetical protein
LFLVCLFGFVRVPRLRCRTSILSLNIPAASTLIGGGGRGANTVAKIVAHLCFFLLFQELEFF